MSHYISRLMHVLVHRTVYSCCLHCSISLFTCCSALCGKCQKAEFSQFALRVVEKVLA